MEKTFHDVDGECQDGFDLLLTSDVTYRKDLMLPPATTISQLLSMTEPYMADDSAHSDDGTICTTTATRQPHCLVAQNSRLLDLRGQDLELQHFQDA